MRPEAGGHHGDQLLGRYKCRNLPCDETTNALMLHGRAKETVFVSRTAWTGALRTTTSSTDIGHERHFSTTLREPASGKYFVADMAGR